MPKKEKQVNVRLSEEQHTEIEEKAKKAKFSTTSEFLRHAASMYMPELCRSFLFCVEADGYDANELTALIQDIRIDYNSVTLTFILDEKNIWKKFIESKTDFKIWWLTRKGEKVDYYKVQHYMFPDVKVFPLHFGHNATDYASGMAVFKS
jgi:hypothetical protein